jgi:hypothetical protein
MRGGSGRTRTRGGRVAIGTAAAMAIAMAMGAVAPAKNPSYNGPIFDSKGKVEFSLERDKGHLVVLDFHANGLPYTCPDGSAGTANFGIKRMRVRHREFEDYTYFGDFRGSELAEVEGRIRAHGRANGIVRYQDGFDGVGLCKSGDAGWGAHR